MYPSPVSFEGQLEKYGETFREFFEKAPNREKEFHVIQCYRSGYIAAEIRTMTGYSAAFVNDVANRFAARCVIEFCRKHHTLIPHCECYEKTKKEKS